MLTDALAARNSSDSDPFVGPDELVREVMKSRGSGHWDQRHAGEITEGGIRKLLQVAYYASLQPYETRYPRITLFVAAPGQTVHVSVGIRQQLDVPTLRRLGPVLEPSHLSLIVEECDGSLRTVGIHPRAFPLTEMALGDHVFSPEAQPRGLLIEIKGPGDLRAGEGHRYRLVGGVCRQEATYSLTEWFLAWAVPTVRALLQQNEELHENFCGLTLSHLWGQLIWRIAQLRHGGCLLVLPDPSDATLPLRHTFTATPPADLGTTFADVHRTSSQTTPSLPGQPPPPNPPSVRLRLQLQRELLALLDTLAQLSATDGCLVFDRNLRLHSFGSMIETVPGATASPRPPVFLGDGTDPLPDTTLQEYGSRRRSAIQLCQACTGAMAFVVSQDGDLRAVVSRDGRVRLYEHLTIWSHVT